MLLIELVLYIHTRSRKSLFTTQEKLSCLTHALNDMWWSMKYLHNIMLPVNINKSMSISRN